MKFFYKLKRCLGLSLIFLLIMGQAIGFAETDDIFRSYNFYTGNVYLMNDEGNSVILRNVKKNNGYGAEEAALELEYSDTSIIKENIFSSSGERLSFETINTYLLDSKVVFLAARNAQRIRILYMEFCD